MEPVADVPGMSVSRRQDHIARTVVVEAEVAVKWWEEKDQ